MKALSLTQPWATLVAIGAKKIETRSWLTHYRGEIAIAATREIDHRALDNEYIWNALRRGGLQLELPTSVILSIAEIHDCISTLVFDKNAAVQIPISDDERAFGDYSAGRYGLLLGNGRRLTRPVPCVGRQRIWNVPPAVEVLVREALAA